MVSTEVTALGLTCPDEDFHGTSFRWSTDLDICGRLAYADGTDPISVLFLMDGIGSVGQSF